MPVLAPVLEERHRPVARSAGGVVEHNMWMIRVADVNPEPAFAVLPSLGSSTSTGVSSVWITREASTSCDHQVVQRQQRLGRLGASSRTCVERAMSMPCRSKIRSSRCSGMWSRTC